MLSAPTLSSCRLDAKMVLGNRATEVFKGGLGVWIKGDSRAQGIWFALTNKHSPWWLVWKLRDTLIPLIFSQVETAGVIWKRDLNFGCTVAAHQVNCRCKKQIQKFQTVDDADPLWLYFSRKFFTTFTTKMQVFSTRLLPILFPYKIVRAKKLPVKISTFIDLCVCL